MTLSQFETFFADRLADHPALKESAKLAWQALFSIGRHHDDFEFARPKILRNSFFGFHDKSPWSNDGRLLAAHKATRHTLRTDQLLSVGYFDLSSQYPEFVTVGHTRAWNWQQGAQLQWHHQHAALFFNNLDSAGRPRLVRVSLNDGVPTEIGAYHIAALHPFADEYVSFSYAPLDRLMPGYGYDRHSKGQLGVKPDSLSAPDGISLVNLQTGQMKPLISLKSLAQQFTDERKGSFSHGCSHASYSPDGRFLAFFYLVRTGSELRITMQTFDFRTASLTQVPVDRPSHYCWGPGCTLFISHRPKGGQWQLSQIAVANPDSPALASQTLPHGDGHPAYSHNTGFLLVDSYPDRTRRQRLFSLEANPINSQLKLLVSRRIPIRYHGPERCDFHPRWRADGRAICIDSVLGKVRCMCVYDITPLISKTSASSP